MSHNRIFNIMLALLTSAVFPVHAQTPAEAPPAQITPTATPAAPIEVNIINPEDLLDYNKTIIVPTVYVSLAIEGRVTARQQSGIFQRGSASALASANFKVSGIDKAFAQSVAQKAYDDFVAKLRATGYTVITYAELKDRDFIKALQREKAEGASGLPTRSEGGITYVTAAPSDDQHFKAAFPSGVFSEFVQGGKSLLNDGTLIIPQYTVVAPQVWGESSRGYGSVSAEVKTVAGMNLTNATAPWMGRPKSRIMRGMPGVHTKQQVVNITERAGTLQQTADNTPRAANVLSGALSVLSGAGNI